MSKTMKAVIFDGPHKVSLQDRPIPILQAETDIIVRVTYTALCGSYFYLPPVLIIELIWCNRELHVFRGHQPSPTGFIMGHEFTGIVTETGSEVKSVKTGDKIVSPFTASWYCLPYLLRTYGHLTNNAKLGMLLLQKWLFLSLL
jgi:threonine dehydrogenase-like Zn-dependent dehydrogenase